MPQVSPTSPITSAAAAVAAVAAVVLVQVQRRPVVQRRLPVRLRLVQILPLVDNVAVALPLELPLVVAGAAVGQPSILPFWIR